MTAPTLLYRISDQEVADLEVPTGSCPQATGGSVKTEGSKMQMYNLPIREQLIILEDSCLSLFSLILEKTKSPVLISDFLLSYVESANRLICPCISTNF